MQSLLSALSKIRHRQNGKIVSYPHIDLQNMPISRQSGSHWRGSYFILAKIRLEKINWEPAKTLWKWNLILVQNLTRSVYSCWHQRRIFKCKITWYQFSSLLSRNTCNRSDGPVYGTVFHHSRANLLRYPSEIAIVSFIKIYGKKW